MELGTPTGTLLAVLLGSVRAAAWLAVCPPFNTKGTPAPVKALLSVAIALPLAPRLSGQIPPDLSTPMLLADVVEQAAIGAALGFLTALLFAAVQSAGNLIDLFGGFSLAFAFDPLSMQGNSVFGRFYNLTAMALMFATDAHQMILRGFVQSYKAIPLTGALSLEALSQMITDGLGQMFLVALQIAGPLIAVLFATDVALGLLSRAAPALNAFGLGFPAKILMTLAVAGTALALLPAAVETLTDKALTAILKVLGG